MLAAVLAIWAPTAEAAVHRTLLLGRSVEGRPISVTEIGDPEGRRVLVVGSIHGDEPAGLAVARRLERLSPKGVDLWIIRTLNPDGLAAGIRGNAHGVDLNRNFPYGWRPLRGVHYSGPRSLSEPETRIAYQLISRLRPEVTIWFHQHLNLVWASGGNRAVAQRFAEVARLPYRSRPALPGSASNWQNHRLPGTTAFAAELPAGQPDAASTDRYARAVLAAGRVPAPERPAHRSTASAVRPKKSRSRVCRWISPRAISAAPPARAKSLASSRPAMISATRTCSGVSIHKSTWRWRRNQSLHARRTVAGNTRSPQSSSSSSGST